MLIGQTDVVVPTARDPNKVEVAVVDVPVKYEPIKLLPKMSPATDSAWPGVVVPMPTLPLDRTVNALVVALVAGVANIENREKFDSDEVAETVNTERGDEVPKPDLDTPAA